MWETLIPAGISLVSNLLGGKMKQSEQEKTNAMNMQIAQQNLAQQQAAMAMQVQENALNRETNLNINRQNVELQREFAKSGIQWRVADAAAAGIHPVAALGGSGASFSPSAHIQGGSISAPSGVSANFTPATGMAEGLTSMGQDVSRAIQATRNAAERNEVVSTTAATLDLENQKLRNELLKSQIARLRQPGGNNPPMPVGQRWMIDGQGQTAGGSDLVKDKPLERAPGEPGNLHREGASITDAGHARTAAGNYAVVPSKDVKERIEDNMFYEVTHWLRNNVMPVINKKYFRPPFDPPQGKAWAFNPMTGEYHQVQSQFDKRYHFNKHWFYERR